ncbi:hypothetical protein [Arhodomonas sp. SL1]|uniref:hypothetical protein n=1 Tax=Arhodomonas sp. SL1 TaxID=3425691 RepID=UPI003F88038F
MSTAPDAVDEGLFAATGRQLRWLGTLGRRLLRLTPGPVLAAIAAFMGAQLLLLAAFLLPLKVILLVAADGVPWYFAAFVSAEDKDRFVLLLAGGAIASYGAYQLCNALIGRWLRRGARRMIDHTGKLHVFDNQDELALQGYRRFVQVAGSAALIVLGVLAGGYLNPLAFGVLIALVVVQYFGLGMVFAGRGALARRLCASVAANPAVGTGVLSSLNFLLVFAALLGQFLNNARLSPVVAIVTIILTRQLLQRGVSGIQDIIYLARNRQRLMTLFFPRVQHVPGPARAHGAAFVRSLSPAFRDGWLGEALVQVTDGQLSAPRIHSRWRDSGMPGLAYFDVDAANGRWFVKYYDRRHAVRAAHEVELFAAHPQGVPAAPKWVGDVFVDGGRLLVFEGVPEQPWEPESWRIAVFERILELWSLPPDPELVQRYQRSHPLLVDRLGTLGFASLDIAAEGTEERTVLERFHGMWPVLSAHVHSLPVVIHNPAATVPGHWVEGSGGAAACLSWQRWSIDTVGCEPLLLRLSRDALSRLVARAPVGASSQAEVTVAELRLVARLTLLEQALRRNNLRQGLDLVSRVLADWDAATPVGVAAQS